jgi:hypothetical protein
MTLSDKSYKLLLSLEKISACMTGLAANKPDKAENHMNREIVYRKVCGRILAPSDISIDECDKK